MIVEGQIHGGVAQGIGGGLLEEMVYDEQGQLLTGTFMDYLVPTAMELPPIETVHLEYPSPRNPLGIKGIGEGGAISPPAALANAVEDALAPFGVRVTRAPLGPSTVLDLIRAARERARGRGRPAMKPAPFEYCAATSAEEAVAALAQHGDDAKVLAGGQSLVPMLNLPARAPARAGGHQRRDGARLPSRGRRAGPDRRAEAAGRGRALGGHASAADVGGAPRGGACAPSGTAARWREAWRMPIPPPSCPRCSSASTAPWWRGAPAASA